MSPTDDKQNRLSTLSQDVIAVTTRKPASTRAPEGTQERRAIPSSQDVFNVPVEEPSAPPPPPRQPAPAAYRPPMQTAPASSSSKTVWVALALAAVSIGVALYAVRTAMANVPAAPVADPQVARLESELKLAKDRVQVLEDKLGAAATDTKNLDSGSQAGLLQVNASMRQLRNDLDHLSNEQAKLSAQLGDVRSQVAAAEKEAKAAQAQAAQASSRADAASRQAPAAPAAASADTQAQLKALGQRSDKMATDIRQLYRLLENH